MTSVLDHPIISERYFFPRRESPRALHWIDVKGARLACVSAPLAGRPTLVHFHGNGEIVADYEGEWVEMVRGFGVGVFLAEYRGYGASTGRPELFKMLQDVEVVCAEANAANGGHGVIAYGRSVGSLFAVHAAATHPLAGLIIESGIADLLERLVLRMSPQELGVSIAELREAVSRSVDQQAKLRDYQAPLLVIHAEGDQLVRRSHADANFEAAASTDKRRVVFPRGGHNDLLALNAELYEAELRRFVERVTST